MERYLLLDDSSEIRFDLVTPNLVAESYKDAIDKIIGILQDGDDVFSYVPDYELHEIHQLEGDDDENYRVWCVVKDVEYFY